MRCPKCQYLSFDNGDRCRNCGYEFSLAIASTPLDLPIQDGTEALGPLADLELRDTPEPARAAASAPASEAAGFELPLFTPGGKAAPPLVTPAPPRAPLSVRRNAPAPPKPRAAAPRAARATLEEPRLALDTSEIPVVERPEQAQRAQPLQSSAPEQRSRDQQRSKDLQGPGNSRNDLHDGAAVERPGDVSRTPRTRPDASSRSASVPIAGAEVQTVAPAAARAFAAILDLAIVGGIDAAVLYLTLRILDLPMADARALPMIPFLAFLLLLNGGYFAAFVAAGGQTIGKMASGIRVVSSASGTERTQRVPVASAIVRAAAYLVSALPAGVGFMPGLSSDHRALHDRLADTRVVKA